MSSNMKIAYGIVSVLFLIALSTMSGDPEYSMLTSTMTVSFSAILTIVGIGWVIIYPLYLRYRG